jgi:diguanylate cyclase (GGDEF)-like protein
MTTPQHEQEIEGVPLGTPYIQRREQSQETSRLIQAHKELLKETEEKEKLKYLAFHDSLTGLLNGRAFDEMIDFAVSVALNKGEKIGLVLADIDGLKHANDTHGHDKGSELIMNIAEVLKAQSRPKDEVFRLHGDEFAILLPGYEADPAKQSQEELDEEVIKRYRDAAGERIQQLDLPTDKVNLSLGVAALDSQESPRDFVRRVDAILYSNKLSNKQSQLRSIN